jgi:hypothetical protein
MRCCERQLKAMLAYLFWPRLRRMGRRYYRILNRTGMLALDDLLNGT